MGKRVRKTLVKEIFKKWSKSEKEVYHNITYMWLLLLFFSCKDFCDSMDCRMSGSPVLHCLREFAQTQVHWVGDAIPPSHPLLFPSSPALNLSQHQGLFQLVSSLHQVVKVLELQLQPQSFQWIFRVDFL